MSKETYNSYEALDHIRARPGMSIGEVTLMNMTAFLSGYHVAMSNADREDNADPPIHGFHEWVKSKFGYRESTAGWGNMIFAVFLGLDPKTVNWETYEDGATSEQHRESVREFYRLLDEYRGTNARQNHSCNP